MTLAQQITATTTCVVLALGSTVGHAASPIVHAVSERVPDERGLIKLARHRGNTSASSGDTVVVTTHYEEICTLPCGVPIDTSERPTFFFVQDGSPVSYGFRLPAKGEVTLSLRPEHRGLRIGAMTTFLLLTVSLTLWLASRSRVSIGQGPPTDTQQFKRLRRARG